MTFTVFIDGEEGTTGLQIRERLEGRTELDLLHLPEERRKDAVARADALNAADIAILCLPDDAAREAVLGAVRTWRTVAAQAGISKREIDQYHAAFCV